MIASLASTLLGVNLLAYAMVVLRPRLYGTKLYRPMLHNIRLSLMPLLLLMGAGTLFVVLMGLHSYFGLPALFWVALAVAAAGLVVWLLLLPNAGYLITELNFNHRDLDEQEVPLWYDIVAVLALALSGVMNMCFNVFIIQFVLSLMTLELVQTVSVVFEVISWGVMVALMLLSSFGIYLGRYIRFNSWDVKHPVKFLGKLRGHFKEKGSGRNCSLFVVFHTLFFVVFYRATVGVVLEELMASIGPV